MPGQAPKIFSTVICMTVTLGGMVFSGCSEQNASQPLVPKNLLSEFDLSTNAFDVCKTKEAEKEIFLKFFSKQGYKIPGNPSEDALNAFFEDLREGYFQETKGLDHSIIQKKYHTFTHALDVMITTHSLLQAGAGIFLKEEEKGILLLAALAHDALHTGVNNSFLAKINHPLVKKFGESGVQEKRSFQFMNEILRKHGILENRDANVSNRYFQFIQESILWTDFARHKELLEEIGKLVPKVESVLHGKRILNGLSQNGNPATMDLQTGLDLSSDFNSSERLLLASFILHCADVSNPGKEWPVCKKWANLIMSEFFGQGDLEKSLSMLPSMNCDRENVSIAECQIGFGQFVIKDLFKNLEKISGDGGTWLSKNLEINQANWQAALQK